MVKKVDLLDLASKSTPKSIKEEKEASSMFEDMESKPSKKTTKKEEPLRVEHEIEIVERKPQITRYPLQQSTKIELPTKEDIDRHLELYNYTKNKIVDKSDFVTIKGREFLKKSGVKKFVNAFNISIECAEERVYELYNDFHAEYKIRAIMPTGQSVENVGICSKSELVANKNYSLHNLKSTAWTRASNRAILDLVAFGEVSAEEVDQVKGSMF